MEKWIGKMTEFAEMAKLTYLIKEGTTIGFIKDWLLFIDLLLKIDKNELLVSHFIDLKGWFTERGEL